MQVDLFEQTNWYSVVELICAVSGRLDGSRLLVSGQGLEPEPLVELGLRLGTKFTTTPVLSDLLGTLVVVGLDGLYEFRKVVFVLVFDFSESNGGAHFSADELSETGTTLDDAVWDVHLSAESWQVDNDLDGVDIVGDDDELSLLLLNEVDDLVDAGSEAGRSLGGGVWLASGACLGSGHQSCLFLGLALWGVFLGELEQLSGGLLVKGLVKLVDAWGNLESLLENSTLSLELDVLGPSHKSGQVLLGLDVLANTKVLRPLLKKRVLLSLLFKSGALGRRCGHSLTFSYHVCSNYL